MFWELCISSVVNAVKYLNKIYCLLYCFVLTSLFRRTNEINGQKLQLHVSPIWLLTSCFWTLSNKISIFTTFVTPFSYTYKFSILKENKMDPRLGECMREKTKRPVRNKRYNRFEEIATFGVGLNLFLSN